MLKPQGSWRDDFYQVYEVADGVHQVSHVFVGDDPADARAEPVGFALTAECFAQGTGRVH